MRTLVLATVATLALGAHPLSAANLSFHGYRKVDVSTWQDTVPEYVYQKVMLGTVQLEACEISITNRGAYLDIVEDAWISGNLSGYTYADVVPDYVIAGTFSLAANAALTGAQTWTGERAYRARLYPAEYVYTQTALDTVRLTEMFDQQIVLLQRLGKTAYQLTLSHVAIGERKRIRIRYLLPNSGGGRASYSVPVVFASAYSQGPRFVKITLSGESSSGTYLIQTPSGPQQLLYGGSQMATYQNSYTITRTDSVYSTVHRTTFDSGAWAGSYALLNTVVPDSVLRRLSRTIDVSIVWRWNAPLDFVTVVGGRKTISDFSRWIIQQASTIATITDSLVSEGHRVGLVHAVEGKPIVTIACGSKGSPEYVSLMDYLRTYNEQYLYNTYKNEPDDPPLWAPVQTATEADLKASQQEFVRSLQLATAMLSDTTSLRHLALFSVGEGAWAEGGPTRALVDSLLRGVSCYYGWEFRWRGVRTSEILPGVYAQNLTGFNGILVPTYKPSTVQLTVMGDSVPYSFQMAASRTSQFAVIMMSDGAWEERLTWTGYDSKGAQLGQFYSLPQVFSQPFDTGLAKLWAADDGHLAQREFSNPGATFGFVTKSMFLRVGIADSSADTSSVLPFLTPGEITWPVAVAPEPRAADRKRHAAVAPAMVFKAGMLTIASPHAQRLLVFDMRGRVVLTLDLTKYRTSLGSFRVPLAALLARVGRGTYVCRIEGAGVVHTLSINAGGAL